jgi:uncharacterized RDD family membrane protein YckC
MRWRRRRDKGPLSMQRSFVTPEGVDLRLELGTAGARAAAFLIDATALMTILVTMTVAIALLTFGARAEILGILWLLGFFVLRNGWFSLFEMGGRGATPGKRLVGLRVVARDGARLTAGAVIARNAMREIEVFLPLSFLAQQAAEGRADAFLTIFALLWSGIFLFFPLFNRDRLRIGDLIAGTWVVRTVSAGLAVDLAAEARPKRTFSDAALSQYGVYELQTLEDVLRNGQAEAVAAVARAIRIKASIPDKGDDRDFLSDYYAALCARLEGGLLVGQRRENKFAERAAPRG